jgi:hypothetical protein
MNVTCTNQHPKGFGKNSKVKKGSRTQHEYYVRVHSIYKEPRIMLNCTFITLKFWCKIIIFWI